MIYQFANRISQSLHSRKVFTIFPIISIILVAMLVACGGTNAPSQTASTSKVGGNIGVGLNAELTTLDPVKSSALVDRQVMLNTYDTLVKVDAQNNVQPDLATSWKNTSPTQLVFTLRTDVKFHDGTPFNADAVVFNINRILNTPSSPRHSELASVKSVQAVDASHAQFNLKAPFSPLLATLTDRAGMILSPTGVQKAGIAFGSSAIDTGSGAFIISEWVKSDHLIVKRNPNYWLKDDQGNALPYLQSIRYRPFTNGNTEFNNLETGNINAADTLDALYVANVKANPNLIYKQQPALSFFGFMLNTKVAPLNNVHVRRAIAWAVNRQEIVDNVFKGIAIVGQGPVSPTSWAFNSNLAPYSYNINNAKAELAQSGLTGNVSFTMLIPGASPVNAQEAQFIQSELQPAGITLNIKQEVFTTLTQDFQTSNYQALLIGWTGALDPDGTLYAMFTTKGGFNFTKDSVPEVDAMLEQARTTTDQALRIPLYQEAERLIVDDAARIFIWHPVAIQATSSKVKNYALLPSRILNFTSLSLSS